MSQNDDNDMMTADKLEKLIQGVAKKPPAKNGADIARNGDKDKNTDEEEVTLELGDNA